MGKKKRRKVAWNRVFGVFGGLLALFLIAFGLSHIFFSSDDSKPAAKPVSSQPDKLDSNAELDKKIDEIMADMSRTEKIGQMMIIGIQGTEADEDSIYMLTQFHFGGVILFDRNMESVEQVTELNKDLQDKCEEKVPLFIAVDEEGGNVARMKHALPPPLAPLEIGNGSPQQAKKSAYEISLKLKDMGFNLNFAPVADLGSMNGTRHFSDDPTKAANFVSEAAAGYKEAGMLYTLKHFPGIGKGDEDSHYGSVMVDIPRATLMAEDVQPFRKVISNNSPNDFMVMVTHVSFPQIDGEAPASVSSVIMSEILRNELGYKGIIITDDMEMGAIANTYGYRRSALEAVLAGADIVLMCHEPEHQIDAYMGILDALNAGEISQERIDDSVRRILRVKLSNLVKK